VCKMDIHTTVLLQHLFSRKALAGYFWNQTGQVCNYNPRPFVRSTDGYRQFQPGQLVATWGSRGHSTLVACRIPQIHALADQAGF